MLSGGEGLASRTAHDASACRGVFMIGTWCVITDMLALGPLAYYRL